MADDSVEASARVFEEFFALVGYAISKWAQIDRELFDFCKYALNTSEEKTAVIYYKFTSIKEHLMLTDALMKLSLSNRNLQKWSAIASAIDKIVGFRNNLTHDPAIGMVQIQGYVSSRKESIDHLTPLPYVPPKEWYEIQTEPMQLFRGKKNKKILKEDIIEHIGRVNYILREIWQFRPILPKRPRKRPPKSPESSSRRASGSTKPRARAKRRSRPRSSPA